MNVVATGTDKSTDEDKERIREIINGGFQQRLAVTGAKSNAQDIVDRRDDGARILKVDREGRITVDRPIRNVLFRAFDRPRSLA